MTEQLWEPTEWLTLGISEQVDMYLANLEERDLLAVWDTAYINDLPDAAFAIIQPGGEKDADGKTDQLIARGKPIGRNDWMVWLDLRPHRRKQYNDPTLPKRLRVRLIRLKFTHNGKPKLIWLVTTLLDTHRYSKKAISKLYRGRWGVETRIAELKTTLQMNVLRSMSVRAVRFEVAATILAFNLLRTVIHQAARQQKASPDRISFASAIKMVLVYSVPLRRASATQRNEVYTQMLADILTMMEHSPKHLEEIAYCYSGDSRNNMGNSLMVTGCLLGMDVRICGPKALWPEESLLAKWRELAAASGARFTLTDDVAAAVKGVDYLYTDVWVSMGEPKEVWDERVHLSVLRRGAGPRRAHTGSPAAPQPRRRDSVGQCGCLLPSLQHAQGGQHTRGSRHGAATPSRTPALCGILGVGGRRPA